MYNYSLHASIGQQSAGHLEDLQDKRHRIDILDLPDYIIRM